jgi:predicted amidohydrolase
MKYDLLLSGGEVLDPAAGLHGLVDIGIAGGKIVAAAPSLPASEASRTISDASTVTAKRRLIAQMTVKDGRVWYDRPVE